MSDDHRARTHLMQTNNATTGSTNGSPSQSGCIVVKNDNSDQVARNPAANSSPSVCGGARLGTIRG